MPDDVRPASSATSTNVSTPSVDTSQVRLGGTIATGITSSYLDTDPKLLVNTLALRQAYMELRSDLDGIDPNNRMFQDNSVITLPILSPNFQKETDWELGGWTIYNNTAVHSFDGTNTYNYLRVPTSKISSPGYYFIHINVRRIDSGHLTLINASGETILTIDKVGSYTLEYYISNTLSETLSIVSDDDHPSSVSVVDYFGVFYVTARLRDYLLLKLIGAGAGGGDVTQEQLNIAIQNVKQELTILIGYANDDLANHKGDYNPHGITYNMIHAAHENHTHTLASLGAAAEVHTHQPEECGAAPFVHTHAQYALVTDLEGLTTTVSDLADAFEAYKATVDATYVTKTKHSQDVNALNTRIDNLDLGGATPMGADESYLPPLTISPQDMRNVYRADLGSLIGGKMVPIEHKNLIETIRGTFVPPHTANSIWDFQSGKITSTIPKSAYYGKSEPGHAAVVYTDHIGANDQYGHMSLSVSLFQPAFLCTQDPTVPGNTTIFTYEFNRKTSLRHFTLYRASTRQEEVEAAGTTASSLFRSGAGGLASFRVTAYDPDNNVVIARNYNLTTADWGMNQSMLVDLGATYQNCKRLVVDVQDVHWAADATAQSFWSFGMRFFNTGADISTIQVVQPLNIVGQLPTKRGTSDVTATVPRTVTLPLNYYQPAVWSGSMPVLTAYLKLAKPVEETDGHYELAVEFEDTPIERHEGNPYGFGIVHQQFRSTAHSYIGTVSDATVYGHGADLLQDTVRTYTITFAKIQTVVSLQLFLWSVRDDLPHWREITADITDSLNTVHTEKFTLSGTDTSRVTRIDGSDASISFRAIYELTLKESIQDVVNIDVTIDSMGAYALFGGLDVIVVGLAYDTNRKTFQNYRYEDTEPIAVLGRVYPLSVQKTDLNESFLSVVQGTYCPLIAIGDKESGVIRSELYHYTRHTENLNSTQVVNDSIFAQEGFCHIKQVFFDEPYAPENLEKFVKMNNLVIFSKGGTITDTDMFSTFLSGAIASFGKCKFVIDYPK